MDRGEDDLGFPSMARPKEAEPMEVDEEPPRYHQRPIPQPSIHSTYDYEDCQTFPGNNRCEYRSMQTGSSEEGEEREDIEEESFDVYAILGPEEAVQNDEEFPSVTFGSRFENFSPKELKTGVNPQRRAGAQANARRGPGNRGISQHREGD